MNNNAPPLVVVVENFAVPNIDVDAVAVAIGLPIEAEASHRLQPILVGPGFLDGLLVHSYSDDDSDPSRQ